MAYIQKREPKTKQEGKSKSKVKVQWIARWDHYIDGERTAKSKSFDREKDAKDFLSKVGLLKPTADTPFKSLADAFLDNYQQAVDAGQREHSTVRQLRQHFKLHILPDAEFSGLKCGDIGTPEVQLFLDRLYAREGVSPSMASKVRVTLSQMFSFGVRRGYASSNPVRETEITITSRPDVDEEAEPFVLPSKDDLRALMKAALAFDNTGRVAALIWVAMYAGLRISEARGLRKRGLKLGCNKPRLQVTQRADQFGKIGRVKAEKSLREVVLGPDTAQMLSTWLEAAPDSDLVFPNDEGKVWSYSNFWNRVWVPLMNRAGLVSDEPASKTVREASKASLGYMQPRFAPHMLRHVYASLQIEQGVQPKRLQALMGHSTLQMTMDRYGHLWPDEAGDELAARVESALA